MNQTGEKPILNTMSYTKGFNQTYTLADSIESKHSNCLHDEQMMYPFWQGQTGNSFNVSNKLYKIIFPGVRNRYSGPDFKNAILATSEGKQICGDVEIHTNLHNWDQHGHRHDPKYANVILHVVLDGVINSVKQTDLNIIPTVKLMDYLPLTDEPCRSAINWIEPEEIFSVIQIYAKFRWDQLKLWMTSKSEDELAHTIFMSVAFHTNSQQIHKIHQMFMTLYEDKNQTMHSIISHMCYYEKSIHWEMGSKFPSSHPSHRMAIVTWLVFSALKNPSSLINTDLKKLKQVNAQLKKSGFLISGLSFLQELLGNFILPFVSATTGTKLFQIWNDNPVQSYSIVKNRFKVWGISNNPITFGMQQGMLYLEKSQCSRNLCHHCSLLRWNESRCFTT